MTRQAWDRPRRADQTNGWQRQADSKRILAEHDGICHVCGKPGATIVDHVIPMAEGGPDDDSNKRPIHPIPCHRRKTAVEAARGRKRKGTRRRPAERHPGELSSQRGSRQRRRP